MFSPALNALSRLLALGALRGLVSQLKTPGGAILALAMVGIMLIGIGPALMAGFVSPMTSTPLSELFSLVAPAMLLAVLTLSILSDAGRTLLELRPPELQFVLAGPFTDSQILTYRLSSALLAVVPIAFVAPLILNAYMASFVGGMLGFVLVTLFVFLLTFLYSLTKRSLNPAVTQAIRLIVLLATVSVP
ncbi:MAG: putative ABC exporter domain-containing protein, partial [Planctomycetota bacterium]